MLPNSREQQPVILLAHPDPVIRLGLDMALQRAGFDGCIVCATPCGADYAQVIATAAVVVTDYEHGLAICQQVRRLSWAHTSQGPKVLVVSHRQGEHEIRTAISAGVMGYLFFGFELGEFIKAVDSLVRNCRYLTSFAVQKMAESMMYEDLTPRELQVLLCLVEGQVNKQISEELQIALGTVKSHVKAIFSKFGVVTRTQAVRVAHQRGISEVPNDSKFRGLDRYVRSETQSALHG